MKKLLPLFLFVTALLHSQEYFPINTGVKTSKNTTIAFTNAKIYITPTTVIENGTLLIKDGKVIRAGKQITIPKEAKKIDIQGKSIYPSFIDVYSSFGILQPKKKFFFGKRPQYDATRKGYYWNDHIRTETNALDMFKFDSKKAKELLKIGFGVVNTHFEDGIMQGTGILVGLNPNSSDAYRIIDNKSGNYLSFSKSSKSNQIYPSSIMGAMALIRQTYLDADWYAKGNTKNTDQALEALNKNKNLPQFFNAGSYLNALRCDKIADEFNTPYIILGGGDEYKRIEAIKKTAAKFVIPINFRKAYDVSNPQLTNQISLSDMRAWNQEPANPSILDRNGVKFALTTQKLKSTKDFLKNLQKAIQYGLNKTTALESLTTIPASLLGKTTIGNLKMGSYANFLITSGDIFDPNTILYENWVQGNKNIITPMNIKDISGVYKLVTNDKEYKLTITGKGAKQKGAITYNGKKISSKFLFNNNWIQLTINNGDNYSRLFGKVEKNSTILSGKSVDSYGNESYWQAVKQPKEASKKKEKTKTEKNEIVAVSYPNVGFGYYTKPTQETILIKNATIWTSEDKNPVLKNMDMLIKDGKIFKIDKHLTANNAKIIDGTGKFVTAGIIDEHSHIALSSVNEVGHNSTAEVTMEDALNPDDINLYRNVAGGVTSIQLLHGSANPIGARSAIIKPKWGESIDKIIYSNAPKFIKFALGENVKQSNWGDNQTIRFPQTRMGVEQVYMDYFQRAKEYEKKKKTGNYRKDIEMETLLEIINSKRFISCHSYIQSEINMLMKVAEKFGFKVNTFTHILEGYKVADKMQKHGAGGSTFADWWAYKYEVNDAIPYNAAIMHKQGITVAINSDDAEMSRRLNQEAAKTIKYGGLTAQEAWKMITINPAKLLHLDKRTGSLKKGKDADVVVWNGNPLSVYSKPLTTIIDGAVYFDIEKDKQKRIAIKKEKAKLITMMLKEKLKGQSTQKPKKKIQKLLHCDSE